MRLLLSDFAGIPRRRRGAMAIPRIPEKRKKPGVCYAVSDDGTELAVVDVTHPALALDLTAEELHAIATVSVRLRLPEVAHRLADGLAPVLNVRPWHPLHLVNIGGGPSADSWNALIVLRRERPQLLAGRCRSPGTPNTESLTVVCSV